MRNLAISLGPFLALGLMAGSARAAVTVDCTGGPADFPSIGAALEANSSFPDSDWLFLDITGPCVENVTVSARRHVGLLGAGGARAEIRAADPGQPVVLIERGRYVYLGDLRVTGGGDGILIASDSTVFVWGSAVESNSGSGIVVTQGSFLEIDSSAVRDNGNLGIDVWGEMEANGNTIIERNAGHGVAVASGRARFLAWWPGSENVLRDNGASGILGYSGSVVGLWGTNQILDNHASGIEMDSGGTLRLWGGTDPDGGPLPILVQGHPGCGVVLWAGATAKLDGSVQIRGNATDHAYSAGLCAFSNSTLEAFAGPEIADNGGPAVLADRQAVVNLGGVTITGNSGEALRIALQSYGGLYSPWTVSGNGGTIVCDDTSLVAGDLAAMPDINCKQVLRQHGPPRPGRLELPPIPTGATPRLSRR